MFERGQRRLCDPQVVGSNPVGDNQSYELFGEVALNI